MIALKFMGFIASDESRMERFTALSGIYPDDLRNNAGEPTFQGFVLDYALQDEALILEFAASEGLSPEKIAAARYDLPGATYDF